MMETQLLLMFLLQPIIPPTSIPERVLSPLIQHESDTDEDHRGSGATVEVVADLVSGRCVRGDIRPAVGARERYGVVWCGVSKE
jgi:hypothetical protein